MTKPLFRITIEVPGQPFDKRRDAAWIEAESEEQALADARAFEPTVRRHPEAVLTVTERVDR